MHQNHREVMIRYGFLDLTFRIPYSGFGWRLKICILSSSWVILLAWNQL